MALRRKIDRLTEAQREWLRDEIIAAGYGDYEDIADNLNGRLKAAGSALRIQKTAIAEYGRELRDLSRLHAFAGLQNQSAEWTKQLMTEVGLEGEAESHQILFQMINALAFKAMKPMLDSDEPIDPANLQLLGRMMKDVMSSSMFREKMRADERKRVADEAKAELEAEQAAKIDSAVATGAMGINAAKAAKQIMGFE